MGLKILLLARFLALAFLLNWVWETLHASAYVESSGPLLARARHCFPMAMVDALWTAALWAAVTRSWVPVAAWARPSLLWTLAVAGGASATALERYALATDRWTYNAAMPMVPVLNVGLWPLLQMLVVPPAVVLLTALIRRTNARASATGAPRPVTAHDPDTRR